MTDKRITAIKKAFAAYVRAEGCSCCRNTEAHKSAGDQLGKLLRFRKYSDGSGYDFYSYGRKRESKR